MKIRTSLLCLLHVAITVWLIILPVPSRCQQEALSLKTSRVPDDTAVPKLIKNHVFDHLPKEYLFVQCGLEDRTGKLWFGTAGNGIYVYDGKSFLNFTPRDGLCHIDILCCLEDKKGNIWFGTRNGLIRYTPSDKKPEAKDFSNFRILEHLVNATTRDPLPYQYRVAENFVWSIAEDRKGRLWFSGTKSLFIHNPENDIDGNTPLFTDFIDSFHPINKNSLQLKDVSSIIEDKKGNMWFASAEGICCFNGRQLTQFKPEGKSSFRKCIVSKNGDLYFLGVTDGVFSYDGQAFTNLSRRLGIEPDTLVSIAEDRDGTIWLGRNSYYMENDGHGGVWRYNPSTSSKDKQLQLFTTANGLSHNCVFTILADKAGNIWFGTRNTGLCRYDGRHFTDYTDRSH